MTANTAQDKALLKRFGLFGPPGMVFFDAKDSSKPRQVVVGYQNPADFLAVLDGVGIP